MPDRVLPNGLRVPADYSLRHDRVVIALACLHCSLLWELPDAQLLDLHRRQRVPLGLTHCPGCKRPLTPASLAYLHELLRDWLAQNPQHRVAWKVPVGVEKG